MLGGLKFKPGLVFAVIFGCFLAFYITINPCYAAARVTVSYLEQVPNKVWALDSVVELWAASSGHSLELIDYVKQPFVYTASLSPITAPSPIATSYFLNSVDQKMDPATSSEVIGGMKAMSKVLKYSNNTQLGWKCTERGIKWYREHGAFMYAKLRSLKKP